MRPANRPKTLALPSLKLYREDLEELMELFQKHCQRVTLMDEDHVYDSIEEMTRGERKKLGLFHLAGLVPHSEIWVKGKPNPTFQRSAIFVPESSDPANHIFLVAKDLLLARRWRSKILFLKSLSIAGAMVLFVGLFLKDEFPNTPPLAKALWNLSVLGLMALTFGTLFILTQHISYINLEYRTSQASFWSKNKDDILKIVIGAVIGAILTLFGAWIKSHYFRGIG